MAAARHTRPVSAEAVVSVLQSCSHDILRHKYSPLVSLCVIVGSIGSGLSETALRSTSPSLSERIGVACSALRSSMYRDGPRGYTPLPPASVRIAVTRLLTVRGRVGRSGARNRRTVHQRSRMRNSRYSCMHPHRLKARLGPAQRDQQANFGLPRRLRRRARGDFDRSKRQARLCEPGVEAALGCIQERRAR